jgi:hypothetical protein
VSQPKENKRRQLFKKRKTAAAAMEFKTKKKKTKKLAIGTLLTCGTYDVCAFARTRQPNLVKITVRVQRND